LTVVGVVTWVVIGSSCRTPPSCGLKPFREKSAWPNYGMVALEKQIIFQPDELDRPTEFPFLADRIDYLEAYGHSVNEALNGAD
jgi:hypothetical protein